jgi:hypothetical protein
LAENGHETEICQRSMEVDAADKLKAADLAMVSCCKSEGVKEWPLQADRVHDAAMNNQTTKCAVAVVGAVMLSSVQLAICLSRWRGSAKGDYD